MDISDSVEEIVKILNRNSPILRAMSFVGQATKNGKGLSQRDQLEVIERVTPFEVSNVHFVTNL